MECSWQPAVPVTYIMYSATVKYGRALCWQPDFSKHVSMLDPLLSLLFGFGCDSAPSVFQRTRYRHGFIWRSHKPLPARSCVCSLSVFRLLVIVNTELTTSRNILTGTYWILGVSLGLNISIAAYSGVISCISRIVGKCDAKGVD